MQIFQIWRLLFFLFFYFPFRQEIFLNNKLTKACLAKQVQRSEILAVCRINNLIEYTQFFSFKQNHSCKVFITKFGSYMQQSISSKILLRKQIFPYFICILTIIIIPVILNMQVISYNVTFFYE